MRASRSSTERGRGAEATAEAFLCARGLRVVARNYRCRLGEVDLIMRHAELLVFVEVRFRSRSDYGGGVLSVDRRKQARVARVAADALRSAARRHAAAGIGSLERVDNELPIEVTTISRRVRRDEALTAFVDHIATLDETDRGILLHRGLEGLEHTEVAELLDLSAAAAMKRWQRLRDRLRELPLAHALLVEF